MNAQHVQLVFDQANPASGSNREARAIDFDGLPASLPACHSAIENSANRYKQIV